MAGSFDPTRADVTQYGIDTTIGGAFKFAALGDEQTEALLKVLDLGIGNHPRFLIAVTADEFEEALLEWKVGETKATVGQKARARVARSAAGKALDYLLADEQQAK